MLGSIVLVAALIFALVAPVLTLIKFYRPSERSTLSNIFWIIVTIVTLPLVPIVMATRHRDKTLLSLFWVSFLVMSVAGWYWVVLNVDKLIHYQTMLTTAS